MRTAKYSVYENWRARGKKAVVHRATCGFCNNGARLQAGTRSDNGRWTGPFPSLAAADAAAALPGFRMCVAVGHAVTAAPARTALTAPRTLGN